MKNCIMLWKNDAVDLAINNQRRAFSDAYNNEVPAESKIYIELSSKNPLSKLSSLETEDLKNTTENRCTIMEFPLIVHLRLADSRNFAIFVG